jgi:SAM-dependent methyltransferase
MIKILPDIPTLDMFIGYLKQNSIPLHRDYYKNWDMYYLTQFFSNLHSEIKILDSGCWGLQTAGVLKYLGYTDITCIDLYRKEKHWNQDLKMNLILNTKLEKGNAEKTRFSDRNFDLITSVSVIEHGVNLNNFLKESSRILKNGGFLFLTCDYWQDKIDVEDKNWNIFNRNEIVNLISIAENNNLKLLVPQKIPQCGEKVVKFLGYEYTFMLLIFQKGE